MDIGKYSFLNRTIKNWNQLPAGALGTFTCKTTILEREESNYKLGEVKELEVWWKSSKNAVNKVNCSDVRWTGVVGSLNGIKPNDRVVKMSEV